LEKEEKTDPARGGDWGALFRSTASSGSGQRFREKNPSAQGNLKPVEKGATAEKSSNPAQEYAIVLTKELNPGGILTKRPDAG